jgi:hypothetical protein
VEQQYNGRNSTSRLTGAAIGSLKDKNSREVVLLDRGNKVLIVYSQSGSEAPTEPIANIELNDANYSTINLLDLDGDGKDDIILTADDRISVIYTHPLSGGLETVASASTPVEDGGYGKVYTANLIDTPEQEVVGVEMKENLMEIFAPGRDEEKRPALLRFYQFKMFDMEASLARRQSLDAPPEPRELLAVDINDDGMPEIVTIMHDNVVIYYPQK